MQVEIILLLVQALICFSKKSDISSKDMKVLLEKARLSLCHIFSAGFSSGAYGGRKIRAIFWGMIKDFALWNAPLSSMIILNSWLRCCANESKKS